MRPLVRSNYNNYTKGVIIFSAFIVVAQSEGQPLAISMKPCSVWWHNITGETTGSTTATPRGTIGTNIFPNKDCLCQDEIGPQLCGLLATHCADDTVKLRCMQTCMLCTGKSQVI